MESFFATPEGELVVEERDYLTRDEARADVFQYVEGFYNRRRLHSGLATSPRSRRWRRSKRLHQPRDGVRVSG